MLVCPIWHETWTARKIPTIYDPCYSVLPSSWQLPSPQPRCAGSIGNLCVHFSRTWRWTVFSDPDLELGLRSERYDLNIHYKRIWMVFGGEQLIRFVVRMYRGGHYLWKGGYQARLQWWLLWQWPTNLYNMAHDFMTPLSGPEKLWPPSAPPFFIGVYIVMLALILLFMWTAVTTHTTCA